MPLSPMRALPLASLGLALAACSTPIIATDAKRVAEEIGHIRPSRSDSCDTQRQIAEQSSRIETIIAGREIVYRAPACAAPSGSPKTS